MIVLKVLAIIAIVLVALFLLTLVIRNYGRKIPHGAG